MSKITTVYDEILTQIATLFPAKTRIFNQYSLIDNPEHVLRNGYGLLKIDTNRIASEFCNFTDEHGFEVVLTKELPRTEDQMDPVDDVTRDIIEDAFSLRERIYRYDKLGLQTDIENTEIGSVSGITYFLGNNKSNFISISVAFTISINENFN